MPAKQLALRCTTPVETNDDAEEEGHDGGRLLQLAKARQADELHHGQDQVPAQPAQGRSRRSGQTDRALYQDVSALFSLQRQHDKCEPSDSLVHCSLRVFDPAQSSVRQVR